MNPRNTFYRDSRALAYGTRRSRFASPLLLFSPSVSSSSSFLPSSPPLPPLFFLFVAKERTEREDPYPLRYSVSQSSRGFAGILSRETTNEASVEDRGGMGRGRTIYFPWMARTRPRVSTRVSSMPRREETAGVGPYTHKRRNAILIIGCDYLCRVTPSHQDSHSRYLLLVLCFGEPR